MGCLYHRSSHRVLAATEGSLPLCRLLNKSQRGHCVFPVQTEAWGNRDHLLQILALLAPLLFHSCSKILLQLMLLPYQNSRKMQEILLENLISSHFQR